MKRDPRKIPSSQVGEAFDLNPWSYEVLKKFRLIFKAVQQHSQGVEIQSGVTSAQLWALWELSRKPGLRVTELAKAMSIHHSTASNLLDKLEMKGLIMRERINPDQRVVTLKLTENGTVLINRSPTPPQGILQHALFELPDNVLISLAENLDELVKKMEIKNEEAAMQPINPLLQRRRSAKKR